MKEGGKRKPVSIQFHHSTTVQEMDAHLSLFLSGLKDDEYAIYAQDSLDSINDAGEEEAIQERMAKMVAGKEVVDKGSYNMGKQKFLSKFFADHVDELRALCGSDPSARKLLRQLVIDKWEAEEAKAAAAVGFEKTFDNFD